MKPWCCLILVASFFVLSQVQGQQVFRWVDEKGTLHFVDDLTLVPEKYREQAQKKEPPTGPASSPSASPKGAAGRAEPQPSSDRPPPERKDLYGRGEDWWRTKAKDANEKLREAQQNYDSMSQALKAKERQREEGPFKSHGPRKRLQSEIEKLQEKVKESQKELEEARELVEKTLPRQAEDYKADPDWLKPKEQKEAPPPPEGPPDPKK